MAISISKIDWNSSFKFPEFEMRKESKFLKIFEEQKMKYLSKKFYICKDSIMLKNMSLEDLNELEELLERQRKLNKLKHDQDKSSRKQRNDMIKIQFIQNQN